jgi:hypothetical protein
LSLLLPVHHSINPSFLRPHNTHSTRTHAFARSKTDGSITDETRIKEALPTINFLVEHGAKVLLASHCGRPKGQVNEKMRMKPMAECLSKLVGEYYN